MAEMQASQKRQCWECLRRRLVCDFTQPSCKKCIKFGVNCPGYDEKKPLKWLPPGKVNSKRAERPDARKGKGLILKEMASYNLGEHFSPEYVLEQVSLTIASLRSEDDQSEQDIEEIPRFDLLDETSEVVRAVQYYNMRVYPEMQTITQMAPNPFIMIFPVKALHYVPLSIHHTVVCFALSHHIHLSQKNNSKSSLTQAWTRVYHNRGLAIRYLGEMVARDDERLTDQMMTSIVLFMVADILLHRSFARNWKNHAVGMIKLLNTRGGYAKMFRLKPHLQSVLVVFLLTVVLGNTTSPPAEHVAITSPLLLLQQVTETYDTIFPHCLCPMPLFLDVLTINNLRSQTMIPDFADETTRIAGEELLARILSFSPEEWTETRGSSYREEWKVISHVYQSAIVLYCILSLQSLSILARTPELDATETSHGDRLFALIPKALSSIYTKKYMMWPLAVAGMAAGRRSVIVQGNVEHQLEIISHELGTATPLHARSRFKAFWASGMSGWDDCFDTSYTFFC